MSGHTIAQITPTIRLQWASIALEEAVGRLARDRFRSPVYIEAAVSRYVELQTARAIVGSVLANGRRA